MADKSISELGVAEQMTDDAKLVVYQNSETKSIEGVQIKGYAREAVKPYTDAAAKSAQAAAENAEAAKASEAAASGSAAVAKEYSGNPPEIREGTWWIWKAESGEYVDTGSPAQGNLMYATFFVDPATGRLYMEAPDEYRGPSFALVNGHLEVSV